MKILFDHPSPFFLAHGGFQIQIEQTKAALESNGVEVEYLRWWDERQRGDLVHFFGRPNPSYISQCHQKKIKVVLAELLTGQGSRSSSMRTVQKLIMRAARTFVPDSLLQRLSWDSYFLVDACIALTSWEAHLMKVMFDAPDKKIHVVANGVEEIFLQAHSVTRGKWLVCTATITERKRIVELAEAAVEANTPLWVIGKSYGESDDYANRFLELVVKFPSYLRYEGAIQDRATLAQIYREARGFVLLSAMESLSLSALEAAACGSPLLLSDLPWAKSVFKNQARYCPLTSSTHQTSQILRKFYNNAPQLRPPSKPQSWIDIGQQLKAIYGDLLKIS